MTQPRSIANPFVVQATFFLLSSASERSSLGHVAPIMRRGLLNWHRYLPGQFHSFEVAILAPSAHDIHVSAQHHEALPRRTGIHRNSEIVPFASIRSVIYMMSVCVWLRVDRNRVFGTFVSNAWHAKASPFIAVESRDNRDRCIRRAGYN